MEVETITDADNLLIRRLTLAAGESMYWHIDRCRRFTVVVAGTRLAIEHMDSGDITEFDVHPGMADWDEPHERIHRAINRGAGPYQEVVTFYRTAPGQDPQPKFNDLGEPDD